MFGIGWVIKKCEFLGIVDVIVCIVVRMEIMGVIFLCVW